jgi:hypothetical protein
MYKYSTGNIYTGIFVVIEMYVHRKAFAFFGLRVQRQSDLDRSGFENCSLAGAAVHNYADWLSELEVAYAALLFYSGLLR